MTDDKDYNPHELTDTLCVCDCGNRMPLGLVKAGWRYLRGHKPTQTVQTLSGMRKHVKGNIGPEQIDAYFTAQVEQMKANGKKLKDAAEALLAAAKVKMNQAKEIDDQIAQLRAVKSQTQDALGRIFKPAKTE